MISEQILPQPKAIQGKPNSQSVGELIELFYANLYLKIYVRKSYVNVRRENRFGAHCMASSPQ